MERERGRDRDRETRRDRGKETLFSTMMFYIRYTNIQSLVLLVLSPKDKEKLYIIVTWKAKTF